MEALDGTIVIPATVNHKNLQPPYRKGLKTKVNAKIGT